MEFSTLTFVLKVYALIFAFAFGTVFGSFITCTAERIITGRKDHSSRSHCDKCGHVLNTADLIPVVSYFMLRGRCRYCGKRISPLSTYVEVLLGGLFMAYVIRFGLTVDTIRAMALTTILTGISITDFKCYLIPNGFILSGILVWLCCLVLEPSHFLTLLFKGLTGAVVMSAGLYLVAVLFEHVKGRESLGGGDIKLFFVLGLYFGLWESLFNLILSCILGILLALLRKNDRIPFGPAASAASVVTLLSGEAFVSWYLSLLL